MSECSRFVVSDEAYNEWEPCHCPVCGGFLKQDFPLDTMFKCKKCGTELMCFTDENEDPDTDPLDEGMTGRICPISKTPRAQVGMESVSGDEKHE